jgi:hypothetical protein
MTDNFAEVFFSQPCAVCRQAAPLPPLHITQINNVGIKLECMFLKPFLKYLNNEFQKSKKVKRTTILSGLCHCYLNSKQSLKAPEYLKSLMKNPIVVVKILMLYLIINDLCS